MKATSHTARPLTRWLVLALATAAIAVPAAQAANRSAGDGLDRYLANNLGLIQAQAAADAIPDALDRYLGNNAPTSRIYYSHDFVTSQFGTSPIYDSHDFVSPQLDTSPIYDSHDFVSSQPLGTPTPVDVATEPGFDWADAGIGAGIAFGAVLLAFAAAFGVRSRGRVAHS